MKSRRKFSRKFGKRPYKKMFVIAAEGAKTEPQYFNMLNCTNSVIHLKCLKNKHASSPDNVLKTMQKYIKSTELKKKDEAWLVIDKDSWSNDQIEQLFSWSEQKENYYFALSNPKFEYWLLLHFEDANGITSSRHCSERLRRYIPNYNKNIIESKLKPQIGYAIERAKQKYNPECADWPRRFGSTVYKLVEKIYKTE